MQIIKISKSELLGFVESSLYRNSSNIPITKARALSQGKNPRASDSDILLIVAVDGHEDIVGYIGALPETIKKRGEIKFAWNSCWWVQSGQSAAVSLKLLSSFFVAYDNRVMMRDLTDTTKRIITSFKDFFVVKELVGQKFFFRFDFSDRVKKFTSIFRIFDGVFNFVAHQFRIFFRFARAENVKVEFSDSFYESDRGFISVHNRNELFARNVDELNWIIENPWITVGVSKDEYQRRYYFSSVKKSFSNKVMRISNVNNELIALIFLKEIEGRLEIPYVFFDEYYIGIICGQLMRYIVDNKVVSFLTFNEQISVFIRKRRFFYFYFKKFRKEFIVHKESVSFFDSDFVFQDGEGDFVFT